MTPRHAPTSRGFRHDERGEMLMPAVWVSAALVIATVASALVISFGINRGSVYLGASCLVALAIYSAAAATVRAARRSRTRRAAITRPYQPSDGVVVSPAPRTAGYAGCNWCQEPAALVVTLSGLVAPTQYTGSVFPAPKR